MKDLQNLLAELQRACDQPRESIARYQKETGRPAVGCFPEYCPEEIIHAAGLLPLGLWGGNIEISRAYSLLPPFACPLMQANMELALQGEYDGLAAVVVPILCDTLKSMGQNFIAALPALKTIPIVYPQMRRIDAGVDFLTTEFGQLKREIERIAGASITDLALAESIKIYNEHRRTMRLFAETARFRTAVITPPVRQAVIRSGSLLEKSRHTTLVKEIIAALQQLPEGQGGGKRVVLSGIMAEPVALLDIMAGMGFVVVADDLAQESRQFRTDVPTMVGENPFRSLARQWAQREGCSLVYDPQKKRADLLVDLVDQAQADAVIVCMMKFCDPEEFDYPILAGRLAEAGIPVLYLEVDLQAGSLEQFRTRLQGFAEMLEHRRFAGKEPLEAGGVM